MLEESVRLVFVTGPDADTLQSIGSVLVEESLAAISVADLARWERASACNDYSI